MVFSRSNNDGNVAKSVSFDVDTVVPTRESLTVDGDELVLEYDEDLDEDSGRRGYFRVEVNNAVREVRTMVISEDEITLTLEEAVERNDGVRIDYDPGNSPITDLAGNEPLHSAINALPTTP